MRLVPGIPRQNDYLKLLKDDIFIQMEAYSNKFLKINKKVFKNFHLLKDPLHNHIFRQWEYPFCYFYIKKEIESMNNKKEINILDAGSGCTFFPYYLKYKFPNLNIYCGDMDTRLAPFFTNINKNMNTDIKFKITDLRNMVFDNDFFDIVYCISVLEHTTDYELIIKEFQRVLKPNGLLIITFDISLDNRKDIPIEVAQDLLEKLNNKFQGIYGTELYGKETLLQTLRESDILTTDFARKFNKKLLPWRLSWKNIIYNIIKLQIPKKPFYSLTVFCGVWRCKK